MCGLGDKFQSSVAPLSDPKEGWRRTPNERHEFKVQKLFKIYSITDKKYCLIRDLTAKTARPPHPLN